MVISRTLKESKPKSERLQKEEQKHNNEIISNHISKLRNKSKKDESLSFWTFADRAGFKKIKGKDFDDIQKYLKADVEKYKNRKICQIHIYTPEKPDKYGTWLYVGILAIHTDDKANMRGKNVGNNGCGIMWKEQDFKTTKFSYKLIEAIMHPIADNKHSCSNLSGFHVTKVVNDLKKKGIKLDEFLNPLANLI